MAESKDTTLLTNDPEEILNQEIKKLDRWFRGEIAKIIVGIGKKEITIDEARNETRNAQAKYRKLILELKDRF